MDGRMAERMNVGDCVNGIEAARPRRERHKTPRKGTRHHRQVTHPVQVRLEHVVNRRHEGVVEDDGGEKPSGSVGHPPTVLVAGGEPRKPRLQQQHFDEGEVTSRQGLTSNPPHPTPPHGLNRLALDTVSKGASHHR